MFVSVLAAPKIHDQNAPKLFPKVRDSTRAYQCQQLVGPLPRPPATPIVSLHNPTTRTWPWEVSFITDSNALAESLAVDRRAMHCHFSTWTLRTHAQTHTQRPYVYRVRRTAEEAEEARLQRALAGSLNTSVMPSASLCAKRGGSTTFASELFPVIGSGRVPQAPYSVTVRRRAVNSAQVPVTRAPQVHSLCPAHCLPACSTCKRLRIPAALCCSKGHHNPGHIDRRPLSKTCALHGLPPCPRRTLMQRGVRHCCARGHHKVCNPARTRIRPAAPPEGPRKRQCLRSPGPSHYPLVRSSHIPLTPPVPKRRRPKTPPPPIAYGRPAAGKVRRRRDGRGSPPVWTGAWKGNTENNINKARTQRF